MVNTAVTLCGLPLENPSSLPAAPSAMGMNFAQIRHQLVWGTFSLQGDDAHPHSTETPPPHRREYAPGAC